MQKLLHFLFYIIAILTIIEYIFICGTFTGPIMMLCIAVIGLINVIYSFISKNINESILYAISTIALCIAYLKIMFL